MKTRDLMIILFSSMAVLFLCQTGLAAPLFNARFVFKTGDAPYSVAIGDLDGNGALDLAVANKDSANMSVLLGNGDGTFQSAVNYGVGDWPLSVAIGDLDGDGVPDLAVANSGWIGGGGNVSVLLGNGDGTFQSAVDYGTRDGCCSVAIGDLDGDGDLDLAVANGGTNYVGMAGTVSVLLGNGDGTFQSAVDYGTRDGCCSVAIGDLDGNGALDLAVANGLSDNVSVLLGNGDGTFQGAVDYEAGDWSLSVAIGDLDGNGAPDLAVVNQGSYSPYVSGTVSVLLGNGDGTFQGAVNYGVGDWPSSVALGDLDGNGALDLAVVANKYSDTVSVLLGNGDGTFQSAVSYETGQGLSVALGDLDGDGALDLAVANEGSDTVSVLLGNGDGTFQSAVDYGVGGGPRSVAIGDLDGDAALDLAVAAGRGVSVLLGNGDGTFQSAVSYEAGYGICMSYSVAIGDLDGDGALDLAVANQSGYIPLAIGDLDGDSATDLAVTNGGSLYSVSNNVSVFLGNGDGTFRSAVNYEAGNGPRSAAIGDLDGDGALDLAVAAGRGVSVLLGNGDGTFRSAVNYEAGDGHYSVAIGDLDGDGALDLAVANYGSANVSVLLGNGDGTFQSAVNYGAGDWPQSIALGDLDGDGAPDLAVANEGSANVSVLLGTGDGTFQNAIHYKAGDWPQSAAIGDLDGDGVLELAVANSGNMSVLLGNGDGTFQSAVNYGAGVGPGSVAIGDLDGDGALDLAVANAGSNTVSVLTNSRYRFETVYPKGWSMISLPVAPQDARLTTLFPDAEVVYKYQKGAGYVRVTGGENLEVGVGYWILLDKPRPYVLEGTEIMEYTIPVADGWYMIGGCSSPAQKMVTTGSIDVIYEFKPGAGYTRVPGSGSLEPGKGYWILFSNTSEGAEFTASSSVSE